MSKNLQTLIRIVVSAVLFVAAILVTRLVPGIPWWGDLLIFLAVYGVIACDVIARAAVNIVHGKVFDENFLMLIATVGAFVISEYDEAVAVMLFYQVGELFQSFAVNRSRASIASLMQLCPERAVVLRDGAECEVDPEEIEIGEIMLVRAGEKIALDGVVVEGESTLDLSGLTGESVPVAVGVGTEVLGGSVNGNGVLRIRVRNEYADSTVARILELVEDAASKKAKTENFITRFARWYTPAVVCAAALLALVPSLVTGDWQRWLYAALSFLVVSCPCALVISVPLGFFGGIGAASKRGILVKGGVALEGLARADTFVFDKTGTITKGRFEVTDVIGDDRAALLRAAAICEAESLHPVALAVRAYCGAGEDGWTVTERAGRGMCAKKDGATLFAGNARLMLEEGIAVPEVAAAGTLVHVARDGKWLGCLAVSDVVKESSASAVAALNAVGRTVMLTGDAPQTARTVAESVGVAEWHAGLLPADKVACLDTLMQPPEGARKRKGAVVFAGDGINDAPVLVRADVGVAMGGIGSDAAIEAADVVLMRDDLADIATARRVAKKTVTIVRENIVFALLVKLAILVLVAVGLGNMWLAVFADVGVSVLAILNSVRATRVPRERPCAPRPT